MQFRGAGLPIALLERIEQRGEDRFPLLALAELDHQARGGPINLRGPGRRIEVDVQSIPISA